MANLVASGFFYRLDLTEEGRYSLTEISESTLAQTPDIINIRVYLAGDLPLQVRQFRESVEAMLEELKVIAGRRLQYQFIDIGGNEHGDLKRKLVEQGVMPLTIDVPEEDGFAQKLIFPAAIVNYRGAEAVVNMLQHNCFSPRPNQLICDYQRAEGELEYKFIAAIRRLVLGKTRMLGILATNAQLSPQQMREFLEEAGRNYFVLPVFLDSSRAIPPTKFFLPDSIQKNIEGNGIDVLLIPQPHKPFTERQKYELDQFFMAGGRLMFLGDMAAMDHNLFQSQDRVLSLTRNLNLDDMFLKYGVKINPTLVQDALKNYGTPVIVEQGGQQINREARWPFFVVADRAGMAMHPITQNINAVCLRYASSIDTIHMAGVSHTVLASSSQFSRALNSPVEISMTENLRRRPPRSVFLNRGNQAMATVSEGMFQSLFQGRLVPTDSFYPDPPTAHFLPRTSFPNKLMVVGDGDILTRDHMPGRLTMPFDNLAFLMNGIDYLINDSTYAGVRSKTVIARNLNPALVEANSGRFRFINLVAPVLAVISLGVGRYIFRRRANLRRKLYT